ncbi:MAG: 3-dehydroquinate synthase [Bacteroidetes bacterium B1(2017)]|nr:MAG: 3-dehydroquinate synthase [Bacteroidetes bacterium B1(2017)]
MKEIIQKDYEIFLGDEILEKLAEILINKEYSKIFVLMDSNTHKHCWPIVSPYLVNTEIIVIPAGEANKTIQYAEMVWEKFQAHFADRSAVLLNLGGGVITDLGGFCAATYKRGIDFINIPTTLLSMVDASIGGKLGVDFKSYKNVIGVFKHPKYIFINPGFLATLPEEEKRNGLAEVCKHALIEDKALFEKLAKTTTYDWGKSGAMIFQSLKIKVAIVKKDPFEKDIRKALNFGHTIGHAIETSSLLHDKTPLKHGEAIAIGMICEAFISKSIQGLSNSEFKSICDYFSTRFPKYKGKLIAAELIVLMKNDKKNREGLINFTLLKKIGKVKLDVNCHDELIEKSLEFYKSL